MGQQEGHFAPGSHILRLTKTRHPQAEQSEAQVRNHGLHGSDCGEGECDARVGVECAAVGGAVDVEYGEGCCGVEEVEGGCE